jgi:prepilin-type N-terminal cleavage/methylation domain-containing protein
MKIGRYLKVIFYNKGFTILEVIISIVILSTGILSVTNMQMTSYKINFSSNKVTTATFIAQSLIEELMSLKFENSMLDDFTEENIFTSYEYNANLNEFPKTSYEYDLYKGFNLRWEVDNKSNSTKTIHVIVTWQEANGEKELIFPLQRSIQQSIE